MISPNRHEVTDRQRLMSEIKALFRERLSIVVDGTENDFFEQGVLDSLSLAQLVFHLEDRFGVPLPLGDLGTDSFSSVGRIAELVKTCMVSGAKGEISNGVERNGEYAQEDESAKAVGMSNTPGSS